MNQIQDSISDTQLFINKLKKEVSQNLTNSQFNVEDLAKNVGISRSQLHRKLIKCTGKSISQFIREYRLNQGMELLRAGKYTVSEVSDLVGFGSPTYFTSCFTEFYGFPPGEAKNQEEIDIATSHEAAANGTNKKWPAFVAIGISIFIIVFVIIKIHTADKGNDTFIPGEKSIAILPFKNLSTDPENEYFSTGVIDAIRIQLNRISDVKVISRTSTENRLIQGKSVKELASELGASLILEGTVQRDNGRVRIQASLINGVTETQIWAKNFDRELKDVFEIQNEIALEVANELKNSLTEEDKLNLSQRLPMDPIAYDLYLKGEYQLRTYTNHGVHLALDYLKASLAIDSTHARTYTGIAQCYIQLGSIFGAELNAQESFKLAKPYLDKALELDPDLDFANTLLGFYLLYNNWDIAGAEKYYKKAIQNNYADALAIYADFLNFTRRHDEALEIAKRLHQNEPFYPNSRMVLSYIYNEQYDKAYEFSKERLKIFNNYYTLDSHGFLLLNMKRYDEAISFFEKTISIEGIRYPRMLGWMGAAYAKSGKINKANELITELKERYQKGDNASLAFFIAVIYSAKEDKSNALMWLKTAYDAREMEMPWIISEPQFYNLHDEPKFIEMAKGFGFTMPVATYP